jgi:hypothetical protein
LCAYDCGGRSKTSSQSNFPNVIVNLGFIAVVVVITGDLLRSVLDWLVVDTEFFSTISTDDSGTNRMEWWWSTS